MTRGLTAMLVALMAAYGVFLVYTAVVLRWRRLIAPGPGRIGTRRTHRVRVDDYLVQAGLDQVRVVEFVAVEVVLFVVAAAAGYAIYGGWWVSGAVGLAAAAIPIASARSRRRARRELARETWPRMLEEIRLQAVSLGRSIPQALLSVGLRGPEEMRPAFAAAQREWLISTDLDRTLDVLKPLGSYVPPSGPMAVRRLLPVIGEQQLPSQDRGDGPSGSAVTVPTARTEARCSRRADVSPPVARCLHPV